MIQARLSGLWLGSGLALALAGCDALPTGPKAGVAPPPEPGVLTETTQGPPGAPEGSCWGKTVTPAVIETVTRQVLVKKAEINPDGTIGALPVYRDESKQEIVTPRQEAWFETVCPAVLTPEFVATLQRALAARGLLAGAVTSQMDPATRSAIKAFQTQNGGPESGVLTLDTARSLGLIAVPRTPLE